MILSDSARTHSRLAPSASDRWLECTGSIALIGEEPKRDDDNAASRDGTAAHSLLEVCLKKGTSPHRLIGKKAPNGIVWTEQMADSVERALDYIRSRPKSALEVRYVEAELKIPVIEDKGHIDVGFTSKVQIEAIDYKNGRGLVEAEKNPQMRLYGLGLFYALPVADRRRILYYRGTIIQPNAGNGDPRSEEIPIGELLKWEEVVRKKVKAIRDGKGTLKAGDHCKYCPAAGRCPELAKTSIEAAGNDFEQFMDPAPLLARIPLGRGLLTDKQVKTAWDRIQLIKIWMESIQKTVWNIVADGKGDTIGMKFVEGKSNRRWRDEDKARAALYKLLLPEEVDVVSLIGVPAAEKLLKKEFVKLKAHVEKPQGNAALATLEDPRPAIRATAHADFAEHLE